MMRKLKLLVLVSFLFSAYQFSDQERIVHDAAKAKVNPLEYNLENIESGKALYL